MNRARPLFQLIAVAYAVGGMLLVSGCHHFPKPWLDTHATWMNATTLEAVPPKSVTCPRVSQPYCVDQFYYGHYGECWREWPKDWHEFNAARCQSHTVVHDVEQPYLPKTSPSPPLPSEEILVPLPSPEASQSDDPA